MPQHTKILIKSAGEMATGVAVRLYGAGFTRILMLETDTPLAVRRSVAFSEAVYDGTQEVEGITARCVQGLDGVHAAWADKALAVAVDPGWELLAALRPEVSVDAIIAKRNTGTRPQEAPLVLALGPGFVAREDAHFVIETQRGHNLGRIYSTGSAAPNTGIPGNIGGQTLARVLRAPTAGVLHTRFAIGDMVRKGDVVCTVDGQDVPAAIDGVLRGCLRSGQPVIKGAKLGDIDPRNERAYCFTISEKARTLGGAVLEAVCAHVLAARSTRGD